MIQVSLLFMVCRGWWSTTGTNLKQLYSTAGWIVRN